MELPQWEKAAMAKAAAKIASRFKLECQKVNARHVLSERNVRWREGDIGSLVESARDIVAYAVVGDTAYAVTREILSRTPDHSLYMFTQQAPTAIDISEMFTEDTRPGEVLVIDNSLREFLVKQILQARKHIVDSWVAAIKKTPKDLNLKGLMARLADKSLPFCPPSVVELICEELEESYWSHFGFRMRGLTSGKAIFHPTWAGCGTIGFEVFMRNDVGGRHWFAVKNGTYVGNLQGTLRLDLGPIAIVTAKSRFSRAYCEQLIANRTYGDVILLIGDGPQLKLEAQRVSDYLFGVAIIEH